ncbi:S-layer homology domain-containing protein [Proteocatella sphenisci]|uniref:S-layer homology domain-containing protein n=1 Tax=Proteocatella sphenisci TaxID=181070 RepID=UPI00048F35CC|nr:S-layer homology domain-containing protein [Proteocatella sphenisci]
MKKHFNRAVALVASAALVLSTATPAFADSKVLDRFSDISGHWAVSDLTSMTEKGIMGGYPDNTMRPQQSVTIAESIKLINKSLKLEGNGNVSAITYTDVKKNAWYSNEIAIAVENGYLAKVAPGEKLNPNASATREQLSSMLVQAMELNSKNNSALDKFKDNAKISASLKSDMAAAVEKGLFGGYEDGTIRPSENVIRATMAAVANRTIKDREASQNGGIVLGANDILVKSHGETISGKTVDTLWVAPTEGEGVITLENVRAKKVVVMGENTSLEIKTTVQPQAKEKRAKVAETGSFIGEIEIRVPNAKISVGKGSNVTLLTLKPEAKQAVISGEGTVEKATIGADGVTFNIVGTKFTVAKDVTGTVINKQAVAGNTSGSVTTDGIKKDSIAGGGGGGSSSGGGTAPSYNTYKYNFVVSKTDKSGTTPISIMKKDFKENTKMSFAVVSEVYKAIPVSDDSINQAMPTVKDILNLENAKGDKYVKVLDSAIQDYKGATTLKVFNKNSVVAGYVGKIAAKDNVENNMNLLTKKLVEAGIDSILSDLAILFQGEAIPAKISVSVMGTELSVAERAIASAVSTIDSKLKEVTFADATGKEVVKIGLTGSKTTLSLKIVK